MKSHIVKMFGCLSALAALFSLGFETSVSAQQNCDLSFSPNPAPLTAYITDYPGYNTSKSAQQQLVSAFLVDVTNLVNHTNYSNPPIPYGLYPAYCVDEGTFINVGFFTIPGTLFGGDLYSSCDPNLNSELPPGHPDTLVSSTNWNMVSYILNYHTYNGTNAFYWDVQAAINTLVGSAVGTPNPCGGVYTTPAPEGGCEGYPVYDPVVVDALLTAATNNAATWVPQCGQLIAAIYVTAATNQFLVIGVPAPCTPCIGVSKTVACLGLTNSCGDFGPIARGYVGAGCSGVVANEPAFCYQIILTNCGSVPLTNVTVSDNLQGNLTTSFFTSPSQVFEPGASITNIFAMSFAANATNTVTVTGDAQLAANVTNGVSVYTNGQPVSASDSAVALVDTASLSCDLTLYSPLDLDGNTNDSDVVLPAANYYSTPPTVTLSITVTNTGMANLTDVTITLPTLSSFSCSGPGPFSLAAGASTNIQLCLGLVTCPASQMFNVSVSGDVASDATHCAVYNVTSSNVVACSSCMGSISCTNTCAANLSGAVLLDCNVGSTNLTGDSGLSGILVTLYGATNNALATNTTDANGNYTFTNLAAGVYTVQTTVPTNYIQTYPAGTNGTQVVTITACQNTANVDFGYANTVPPVITITPGTSLGCNPTNLPSISSVATNVTAIVSCGSATTNITYMDTTNGCGVTRTFTIVVTDTYGNSATNSDLIFSWTANTLPPVIYGLPAGTNFGCNPTNVPSTISGLTASNTCGTAGIDVTPVVTTNGCTVTQVFTVVALDGCGNTATAYVTNTWTANTNQPVFGNLPGGTNYGCNPTNAPTAAQVQAQVTASDACGTAPVTVTENDATNGCVITQIFALVAVDGCGNTATAAITNTWTANTVPPVISGVPTNAFLGCGPNLAPGDTNVQAEITVTGQCDTPGVSVTHVDATNDCTGSRTFTITAIDGCGNTTTTNLVYTWTAVTMVAGSSSNNTWATTISFSGSGDLDMSDFGTNGDVDPVTASFNGAGVTSATPDGGQFDISSFFDVFATVSIPPDAQFHGTNINITQPTNGVDPGLTVTLVNPSNFVDGITLPLDPSSPPFDGLFPPPSVSYYTGTNLNTVKSIFGFHNAGGDLPYTIQFNGAAELILGDPPTVVETNGTYVYSYANSLLVLTATVEGNDPTYDLPLSGTIVLTTPVTNSLSTETIPAPPVLSGVPAGTNYGCNPTNVLTKTALLAELSASDTCSPATITVNGSCGTNGCLVTQIFTITAINTCGSVATSYVTNTWTANTNAPVFSGVPAGTNYGCNPASVPNSAAILSGVTASDGCGSAGVSATGSCTTNGCIVTQIFTIVAVDGCGNIGTAYVTNTWTANTTPPVINGLPAGTNYGCNPASVLSCSALLSDLSASNACGTAAISVTNATTTNGCAVTEIFTIMAVDGCGNTATANLTNLWTANTNKPTFSGIPTGTNYGCNPTNVPTAASVKSLVTAGDACGSAGVTVNGTCGTNGCLVTQIFTIVAVDGCGNIGTAYVTNTWTANTTAPVIKGLPAGTNYGCNPSSVLSSSALLSGLSASNACGTAAINVTNATTTNACLVTEVFTIIAVDGCGNTATAYLTNLWAANTNTPVLSGVPAGKSLGCNPTNIPTIASITNVTASDTCSTATVTVTGGVASTNGCAASQIFTITAVDNCGNIAKAYVTNTWTANTTAPVLGGIPLGKSLGCNPTNVPTLASVQSAVYSTNDTCSPATIIVTGGVAVTNVCAVSQVFTIVATNACGNTATAYVTNTWTANTTAPVLGGVPAGRNLGCNPTNIPTLASIQGCVFSTNDTCSPATVLVSGGIPVTNGCGVTQVFMILATNACGNTATAFVTNTWAALPTILVTNTSFMTNTIIQTNTSYTTNFTDVTNTTLTTNITITTNCCTNSLCGTFNTSNPGSGWLWLNAHISGNPGSNCTVNISAGSVTLACANGTTFTYPVPNGQICFSSTCTVATNWYDGTSWHTTLPCAGDSEIFAQGCAIPWLTNFANCKSACWTACFSCSTPGFNCNWQWGGACYSDTLPACGSIAPKACYQTSCPNGTYYNSGDQCGTPENHKPYCVAGGSGSGSGNCTGSWEGTSTTCTFGLLTNKTVTPVVTITTNSTVKTNVTTTPVSVIMTNTSVTTATAGPVLSGVPTGMYLGCNPTNIPTVANIQGEVSASETCSAANVVVTVAYSTNGCLISEVFTITAANACGNSTTAYVTYSWTANTIPPVITGVPAGTFLGCGVTNLPGDTNVFGEVKATGQCGTANVVVTHQDSTNGCAGTRVFTITATDGCGNMTVTNLTYTWTGKVPETCTNSICGGFNSKNPGSGWLWLNAHVSGNPGVPATLYCSNATVTLNCTDGKSYTFPVPNGIINFSSGCTTATNWYDGANWNTTLPCSGDSQIFLQGCAIPWQSDFANCQSVCWTGVFSCTTPGLAFNWQWGAACYANSQQTYATMCPKACLQTSCQNGQYYNANDNAGCPENNKPYCVGGGTGLGGANCTGSWSGTDTTCTFTSGTSIPPVLNGIPANDNLGINPTNIPTVASVEAKVTATDTCSPAPVVVTMTLSTNACVVTQIFNIGATNDCGAYATATVTNTWTTLPLTNHCTNTICSSFNSSNPGSGWLWLNSQLTGKPGNQEVLVVCSNATVTLSCTDGKNYTFPIPNGNILFSTNCTTATNWFDGTNWNTTLPCGGDDQIFVGGCAIPWQSDFANCKSVCWSGVYSCNVPGLSFNWQFGAACYSDALPTNYNNLCAKACHQTSCQGGQYFNQSHNAGTPENHNPYCVSGGTGYGGSNCTGSFSNPGTCNF